MRRLFANDGTPDELHVYVCEEKSASIGACLRNERYSTNGFVKDSNSWQDTVYKLDLGGKVRQVYLHETRYSPLGSILRGVPSTIMLCFMTWNKAYCLFPHSAIINQQGYLLQDLDDSYSGVKWRQQLHQLSKQSVKTMGLQWDEDEETTELTRMRRIDDGYTWVIEFDVSSIEASGIEPVPDTVIETVTVQLKIHKNNRLSNGPICRYEMACAALLSHSILKQDYVTVLNESIYACKIRALKAKMDDLTRIELAKLPDDERPSDYATYMGGPAAGKLPPTYSKWLDTNSPVPEGWTYYDVELVNQLEKLWAKYGAAGDVKEVKENMAKGSGHRHSDLRGAKVGDGRTLRMYDSEGFCVVDIQPLTGVLLAVYRICRP